MSNRKQPFGYRMKNGEVIIDPAEAHMVRNIFQRYLAGLSLKALAIELENQPIRYEAGKSWNKNMAARILEDERYTGAKGYPAILDRETLECAAEIRKEKSSPLKRTEAEKVIRQLSGQRSTAEISRRIRKQLNELAGHGERITIQPGSNTGQANAVRQKLDETMRRLPLDEDRARRLAFQSAAAQYKAIGGSGYETERLRQMFVNLRPMDRLDAGILKAAVSEIQINAEGKVSLRLKNGQVIGEQA